MAMTLSRLWKGAFVVSAIVLVALASGAFLDATAEVRLPRAFGAVMFAFCIAIPIPVISWKRKLSLEGKLAGNLYFIFWLLGVNALLVSLLLSLALFSIPDRFRAVSNTKLA